MSVKVKGISIRNEELSYDVEIPFSNLTVKGQERMFLDNKDIFICEAFASKYDTVRKLAYDNMSDCSSESLNKVISSLCNIDENMDFHDICENMDLIIEILYMPNFVLEDEVREKLIDSNYLEVILSIAFLPTTPYETLCDILINFALKEAFWNYHSLTMFYAVIHNPNFKITVEIEEVISKFYDILETYTKTRPEYVYSQIKADFEHAIQNVEK